MEWTFYFEGWQYLARLIAGELSVRRAVTGRPWVTPPRELADVALKQRN